MPTSSAIARTVVERTTLAAEMSDPTEPSLRDPALAAQEFESETRMLARRLDRWARIGGYDPPGAALQAVREGPHGRVLEVGPGTGDFAERLGRELGCAGTKDKGLSPEPQRLCDDLSTGGRIAGLPGRAEDKDRQRSMPKPTLESRA
jgi:hypothetical protein